MLHELQNITQNSVHKGKRSVARKWIEGLTVGNTNVNVLPVPDICFIRDNAWSKRVIISGGCSGISVWECYTSRL